MALRDAMVRHWPLKLAALALSVIVWVVVASQEMTSQLVAVRVELTMAPTVALARPLPPVTALVSGPGRELIKLYATPLVLRAAVPDSVRGSTYRLDVRPTDVEIPRNAKVTVQEIEPRELPVVLDRMARRTVPVALRAVLHPESGYSFIEPIVVTPATVYISGPRSLVLAFDSIPTEALELRGLTGRFARSLLIDTRGLSVLQVVPREVVLSGRAERP